MLKLCGLVWTESFHQTIKKYLKLQLLGPRNLFGSFAKHKSRVVNFSSNFQWLPFYCLTCFLFVQGLFCSKHQYYIWQLSEAGRHQGGAVNRLWRHFQPLALLGNLPCLPSMQRQVRCPGFSGRDRPSGPSPLYGVQPLCPSRIQRNSKSRILKIFLFIMC